MKAAIWTGITLGGIIGGWLGSLIDHGTMFGVWSILMGVAGSLIGMWAAFRLSQ